MSGEVWSFGDAWVYNATSVLASVPCSSDLNSRPQITVSQSKAFAKSLLNLQISVFAIFSWDEEEGSMLGPWALGALGLCGRSLCACFGWRHFPGVPCGSLATRQAMAQPVAAEGARITESHDRTSEAAKHEARWTSATAFSRKSKQQLAGPKRQTTYGADRAFQAAHCSNMTCSRDRLQTESGAEEAARQNSLPRERKELSLRES